MSTTEYQQELRGKLNIVCLAALREAVALCQSRTFYEVDIPHLMLSLLDIVGGDGDFLVKRFNLSPSTLRGSIEQKLNYFRTGNGSLPTASPRLAQWLKNAWMTASLEFNAERIRGGHLVLSLLDSADWRRHWDEWGMARFSELSPEKIRSEWKDILEGSRENEGDDSSQSPAESSNIPGGALSRFTLDLTARAREGKLDPVLGRDGEIRQIVDILMRRRQNNPILTGEAGVGKTAVVEGFALKIVTNEVPEPLRGVRVLSLDIGLMQAGAGVRGEFENRLKSLIAEVAKATPPVILFIDEAHTIIGAGAGEGKADAANLIKPALARGELRTIAATTWAEYKKYFEKDAALARRFQVIRVEEPDEEAGIVMLRGLSEHLMRHHGVPVLPEAIEAGVRMSARYISGRLLPDKAVSLLDTACARVAIGRAAVPAAVEEARAAAADRAAALAGWERELAAGSACERKVSGAKTELAAAATRVEELEVRWRKEAEIGESIRKARDELSAIPLDNTKKRRPATKQLQKLRDTLSKVQGGSPLLVPEVDRQAVATVVAEWTGIPAGRVSESEKRALLELEAILRRRVVGQDTALHSVADAIRAARAGLSDPRKPSGAFLFLGPSGVGKTETALALAEALFGSERALTVINMSEFKEEHKVSQLTGSPPGYVGYGEGGRLTEAVRRNPYGVLLLDEMEKAHPGVQELFYQVFDKGTLRDGEGRDVDFRHSVIIAASNACGSHIAGFTRSTDADADSERLMTALWPELLRVFKPAFIGRLTPVPYYGLGDEAMLAIARMHLNRLASRLRDKHETQLTWSSDVEKALCESGDAVSTGGRVIEQALSREVVPLIAGEILSKSVIHKLAIGTKSGKLFIK